MAQFKAELPNDLMNELNNMEKSSDKMVSEMVDAGTEVIYNNLQRNMSKSFKSTKSLQKGLVKAKPKNLKGNDGYGSWVGFDGYDTDKITKKYPKGMPIPLIAMAREYGTSRGETKKPFLRPSVNKSQIESAMQSIQDRYIPKG